MNRIQYFLKRTFSYIGGLATARPVTFVTACAGTLTAFVLSFFWTDAVDRSLRDGSAEAVLTQLLIFFSIFCLCIFCVESSPLKGKAPVPALICAEAAGALVSFGLGSMLYMGTEAKTARLILFSEFWKRMSEALVQGRVITWTAGFCIIMLTMGVFFSFRRLEDPSFAAYLAGNYSKLFFANITFFVLLSGIATLTGIFTTLLWGDFSEIYLAVFSLIFGGYLIMRTIACFTEHTEEPNVFVALLIKYVLLIMSLIAFVIIYIYMIKILVLQEFPSNSIFEILTALFVFSMPVAYMAAGLLEEKQAEAAGADAEEKKEEAAEETGADTEEKKEEAAEETGADAEEKKEEAAVETGADAEDKKAGASKVMYKLAAYLPFIFIPFIPLQVYTAGVRIWQYGLTPKRYLGIAMIAVEIIYILIYLLFRKKNDKRISVILPVIAVFALIAAWLPGTNVLDLSKAVQMSFIRSYLQSPETDPSKKPDDAARRAAAAYEYIMDISEEGSKDLFTAEEKKRLDMLTKHSVSDEGSYYPETTTNTWYSSKEELDMDIKGYDRIRYAYLAAAGGDERNGGAGAEADLKRVGLYTNEDGSIGTYPSASELTEEHEPVLQTDITGFAKSAGILTEYQQNGMVPDEMEFDDAMALNNIIDLDDGGRFYVTEADIEYDRDTGSVTSLLMKGYYLSR